MTFNNAEGLHNEDEVTIKETGEIVTILQAYPSENGKYIVLECDNGNTYYNDEVKWNDDFKDSDYFMELCQESRGFSHERFKEVELKRIQ